MANALAADSPVRYTLTRNANFSASSRGKHALASATSRMHLTAFMFRLDATLGRVVERGGGPTPSNTDTPWACCRPTEASGAPPSACRFLPVNKAGSPSSLSLTSSPSNSSHEVSEPLPSLQGRLRLDAAPAPVCDTSSGKNCVGSIIVSVKDRLSVSSAPAQVPPSSRSS